MGKATFFIGDLNSLTISALVACCGQWFFWFCNKVDYSAENKARNFQ